MSERGDGSGSRSGLANLRRALRPRRVLIVLVAVVVVAALGVWARAMVTPVTRAGEPTATVQPLPGPTSASPSETPSPSSSPTASGTPSSTPSRAPTMKSSGKFDAASLQVDPVSSLGERRSYTVRVETSSGLTANKVATQVAGVLNDPRSWAGRGGIRFGLVKDPAAADFSITLASPGTAAKSCRTVSGTCTDASDIVIDALAWKNVPATYAGATPDWQAYLVNHGVGSYLGEKPATCPKRSKPAPVMMAQAENLDGCTPNPWPNP